MKKSWEKPKIKQLGICVGTLSGNHPTQNENANAQPSWKQRVS